MEITSEIRAMLNETRERLSGYERRHFMAQIVETMLGGSPTQAEKQLGSGSPDARQGAHGVARWCLLY